MLRYLYFLKIGGKHGNLYFFFQRCLKKNVRVFDLEERRIRFGVLSIRITENLPKTFAGNHLSGQFVRSATLPALHYGEALSAKSRNDFIHKMRIAAKELRETHNCLKIIEQIQWITPNEISPALQGCNELIAIFVKSMGTAIKNNSCKFNIQYSLFNIHD